MKMKILAILIIWVVIAIGVSGCGSCYEKSGCNYRAEIESYRQIPAGVMVPQYRFEQVR
jgi:uncharacterized protein YceK